MLTRLRAFLDDRLAWSRVTSALLDAPIPGGARWGYIFGSVLVWLFVVEVATGLGLATVYAPSAQTAWSSVFYLEHHFHWGRLVRGVHYWTAQAMLVVVGLHLCQVIFAGAYKRPREFNWWLGLLLLMLTLAFAHTGSLLPWDQQAYWTTQVEAGITSTMPVVGPLAATFLQGGRALGTLSITRLNAVHTSLLPLLTLLVIAAHVALVRRTGPTPPASVPLNALPPGATEADVEAARARGIPVDRYWPAQAARDALAALAVVGVVYYLARRHGAPLTAPADPSGDFPARPEWYLLALFKLRKYFEGPKEILATVVIPGAVSTFFVLLPLIDRAPTRALRARVPYVAGAYACVLFIAGLTVMSVRSDARDTTYQQALRLSEQRAARAMQLAAMGVPPEGPLEMVRNDPQVRPRELFTELCASCHAQNGAPLHEANGHRSAARGPSLQGFGSRAWLRSMLNNPDADDLFGRTNIHDMPSQATRLGPDGMNAVIEYLYGQSVEQGDPPADAALAQRGDEIYHRRCTQCHQGPGDQSETPPEDRDAPELTGWGSRAWIRAQIVNGARPENYGSRNEMPSFSERLAGRELEWVVDYVRGLRAQPAPEVPPPPPRAPEGSGS